jgi:DnaJ-domain-containing protein 1
MAPEYVERRDALIAERDKALRDFEVQITAMRAELEEKYNRLFNELWTDAGYR